MPYAHRAATLLVLLVGCGGDHGDGDVDAEVVDATEVDAAIEVDAADIDAIEIDAGDADADADVDAEVDAPITGPATPFEVAYADEWTFRGVTGAMPQAIGLVINPATNLEPLDLSGLTVVSVTDDHPQLIAIATIPVTAAAPVPIGNAVGDLSIAAEAHITPLVSEARSDTTAPSLSFDWGGLSQATNAIVHMTIVLRNGSQEVSLPFTLTLSTSGVGVSITGATRVASASLL
jgi:hypothetical protein